jgi:16S rRNA (cytidine1402-2'-O)-methyltransferase
VRRAGGAARLVSLTEHNVAERAPELLEAAKTACVALVSDAGTPIVSDPGARLVNAAHDAGIGVFAIPGPSALAAAVSVSGFAGDDVHFLGFLPRQQGERRRRLEATAATAAVLVYFESPGRLAASLTDVAETLADPRVAVCRELTKLHEEVVRGCASALATRFGATKGECTVVVEVRARQAADAGDVQRYMAEMHRAGARRAPAAAQAAQRFNLPRSVAYDAWPTGSE